MVRQLVVVPEGLQSLGSSWRFDLLYSFRVVGVLKVSMR